LNLLPYLIHGLVADAPVTEFGVELRSWLKEEAGKKNVFPVALAFIAACDAHARNAATKRAHSDPAQASGDPTLGQVAQEKRFEPLRELIRPVANSPVTELTQNMRSTMLEGEAKQTQMLLEAYFAACDRALCEEACPSRSYEVRIL
jgi:hypothetical protein